MLVLSYFLHPFPSRKGFSAYRMPGPALHVPLILGASYLGFLLCWPHPALRPLVVFWVLAGIYLGRELTVFCHYAPLLTLVAWFGIGVALVKAPAIARFGATHIVIPAVISILLGVLQILVAYLFTRSADKAA